MPASDMMKPILPTRISTRSYNAFVLNALIKTGKDIKADFEKTVATWQTHHPDFQVKVGYAGGSARVKVWTTSIYYNFIDNGTPVRYATMTPDFVPKTAPHWIGSGPGAGGVRYISRKFPRPGIKAREFSLDIELKNLPVLEKNLDEALFKAMAGSFGAVR